MYNVFNQSNDIKKYNSFNKKKNKANSFKKSYKKKSVLKKKIVLK